MSKSEVAPGGFAGGCVGGVLKWTSPIGWPNSLLYIIGSSVSLHFQSARGKAILRFSQLAACLVLALAPLSNRTAARADLSAPAEVIAHIHGGDVSIDGQMLQRASTLVSVVNGNVVTVHSGEASMQLVDGGEISICGPAQVTVLQSNGIITLALELGSLHADLPKSVSLRVLTPSIVATPIDINGGKRDLTVGLDQSDSLCVLASTGAVQLEQQFSGERLIVPESGDFALHDGQLIPSVDDGRNCKCSALPQIIPGEPAPQHYPAPETADQIPPQNAPAAIAPNPSAAIIAQQEAAADPPPVEVVLLSRPNDDHPIASPPAQSKPPAQLADVPPVTKIVLPPLVFSAASPAPPDIPTEETALLIREVRANPDWEYDGEVQAPTFAKELSKALGEGAPANQPPLAGQGIAADKKPKGFWVSLKKFFVG
jgi:hypothetical protein